MRKVPLLLLRRSRTQKKNPNFLFALQFPYKYGKIDKLEADITVYIVICMITEHGRT